MAQARIRLICLAAVVVGILSVTLSPAEAKADFEGEKEKAVIEGSVEPAAETKPACCPDSSARRPQKRNSFLRRIGNGVTGIFAFGCRINYGLTNWALSDKCDPAQEPHSCP